METVGQGRQGRNKLENGPKRSYFWGVGRGDFIKIYFVGGFVTAKKN